MLSDSPSVSSEPWNEHEFVVLGEREPFRPHLTPTFAAYQLLMRCTPAAQAGRQKG